MISNPHSIFITTAVRHRGKYRGRDWIAKGYYWKYAIKLSIKLFPLFSKVQREEWSPGNFKIFLLSCMSAYKNIDPKGKYHDFVLLKARVTWKNGWCLLNKLLAVHWKLECKVVLKPFCPMLYMTITCFWLHTSLKFISFLYSTSTFSFNGSCHTG